MKKGIIGRKLGMTQLFDEKGKVIPVTVINAGPCVVVQKRTNEKNGYEAVQLAFEDIREKLDVLTLTRDGHRDNAAVFGLYIRKLAMEQNLNACLLDHFEGENPRIEGIDQGCGKMMRAVFMSV